MVTHSNGTTSKVVCKSLVIEKKRGEKYQKKEANSKILNNDFRSFDRMIKFYKVCHHNFCSK